MTNKADKIQSKIWKAYGVVSKTLGREFEVYRTNTLVNPIQNQYNVATTLAAFSQDERYKKAHDGGLSIWLCWMDGGFGDLFDVAQGDVLCSPADGETYFIASVQQHAPIRAIKAPNTINVSRVGYTDTGHSDTDVATLIPCSIQQPSSGDFGAPYIGPSSSLDDPQPKYVINLWDPADTIVIGDVVTDERGNVSQVLSVYKSDMGMELVTG